MNLETFSQATVNVIREDGISLYLPTILLTESQSFRVIEGIPVTVDHRVAIQNVIRRSGYERSEFFFGVRSAPQEITIGHHFPGQPTKFMIITESTDGYSSNRLETCEWWNVP